MSISASNISIWKEPKWMWAAWAALLIALFIPFQEALEYMYVRWTGMEEYSHAPLIPFIAVFLVWQKKDQLEQLPFNGSFIGILFLLGGFFLFTLGELSSLFVIIQYAFIVVVISLFYSIMGWKAFKLIAIPLLILFLMIPLPTFLYNNLSSKLQLISSQVGVGFIRLFDITVFLEGNVIDLGSYQLQVVEACNGLRYLFPLMALGFIMAYFYKTVLWKRILIFVTTIPLTVIMNSIRIGVIGVTVEYWGQEMAEGFLHDFEGWIVFMICAAILFAEMWILVKLGNDTRPFREVFGLEFPEPSPEGAYVHNRSANTPFFVAAALVVLMVFGSTGLTQRDEIIPERRTFAEYPTSINKWKGTRGSLEQQYIDVLKFEDYIIADYKNSNNDLVNFYVAYYNSQRKGESVHSPRSCIPGSGLRIESLEQYPVPNVEINGKQLIVNRAVIREGDKTSLIYYWFQQRGRSITNEYMVKWWLFWDALTKNRSDGSLVRLTTMVPPGSTPEQADKVLTEFAREISGSISEYIPD
ncbi:MAG: VPLPA-CTERM-specific exosortase XrtD [Gammaproteobacteria bacterium]|nr:MAG: VPLPA-CTERM-specific exosortase XrtD [Gammaproteobacteria bacterium]